MSTPFMSEIKIISFNFPPRGWAFCNGQLLPINQNQALFALLGTNYGGDGRVNFGLPDLRGRMPVHIGNGISLGEKAGETVHTLNISELPAHNHVVKAAGGTATDPSPAANVWPADDNKPFGTTVNTAMNPQSILPTGGSQPHENMSPYLVLNFIIALQGIFPSP